jgi:PPP family 3-phenylpropionic acid transporter
MLLLPAALGTDGEAERGPLFRGVLDNPALLTFVTISFLLQVSFGAYYNFFTIYLAGYGHDASTIGALWATGVVAEIAVFIASPWLLARFRLSTLLIVALVGTAVRWTLLAALPESVPVLVMAQSLHLAGFGLFHLVAVLLLPRLLPAGQGTRAQALNSSLGWGAGGIAGSLLSGWIWDAVGPRTAYVAATMVVLLALSLAVPGMTRAAVDGAGAGRTA